MYLLVLNLLFVLKVEMFIKEYLGVASCDLINLLALDSEPYEAFITNASYSVERAFVNSTCMEHSRDCGNRTVIR